MAVLLLGVGFVYSGAFNVAADAPHWQITARLLDKARERSIARNAENIIVPNLDDNGLIAIGADHYAEMCTGCHLAPGMHDNEMRKGLYPHPPNLVESGAQRDPAQKFWIIKHGLKMTAMPAWGLTHDDRSIWGMVAFLRKLPTMSPESYRALTGQSEAEHSHHHGDAPSEEAEH